jgi:hypothetical protein
VDGLVERLKLMERHCREPLAKRINLGFVEPFVADVPATSHLGDSIRSSPFVRHWNFAGLEGIRRPLHVCSATGVRCSLTGATMRADELLIKASEYNGNLSEYLRRFKYQQDLTQKLDDLDTVTLRPELLNELVLWKVNRYVSLGEDQLRRIDALPNLVAGQHEQARSILEELLAAQGVDLSMASGFLRFRNPSVFQIIDRHAYRALPHAVVVFINHADV